MFEYLNFKKKTRNMRGIMNRAKKFQPDQPAIGAILNGKKRNILCVFKNSLNFYTLCVYRVVQIDILKQRKYYMQYQTALFTSVLFLVYRVGLTLIRYKQFNKMMFMHKKTLKLK